MEVTIIHSSNAAGEYYRDTNTLEWEATFEDAMRAGGYLDTPVHDGDILTFEIHEDDEGDAK